MSGLVGTRLADLDTEQIRSGVAALLEPAIGRISSTEELLVVPDVHYPFHPSTGMVTNPDALEATLQELTAHVDPAGVAVGCAASRWVDTEIAVQHLRVGALADRAGVDLLDLDAAERREWAEGRRTSVDVPAPLLDRTVVVVPSLRYPHGESALTTAATLARSVADDPTDAEVAATLAACDPLAVLLDGTYTYSGEPRKTRVLLAGERVATVDRAVATVLDLDAEDYRHGAGETAAPSVDGLSLDAVADSLPRTGVERPDTGGGVMERGYRVYAAISGDLTPPQAMRDPR
jgi:uncharacterized protein (DUF362 family)